MQYYIKTHLARHSIHVFDQAEDLIKQFLDLDTDSFVSWLNSVSGLDEDDEAITVASAINDWCNSDKFIDVCLSYAEPSVREFAFRTKQLFQM